MSIWSSTVQGVGVDTGHGYSLIPERDNYTGQPTGDPSILIDVATATSWNDCIRLIVWDGEAIITIEEAGQLIDALHEARGRILCARALP